MENVCTKQVYLAWVEPGAFERAQWQFSEGNPQVRFRGVTSNTNDSNLRAKFMDVSIVELKVVKDSHFFALSLDSWEVRTAGDVPSLPEEELRGMAWDYVGRYVVKQDDVNHSLASMIIDQEGASGKTGKPWQIKPPEGVAQNATWMPWIHPTGIGDYSRQVPAPSRYLYEQAGVSIIFYTPVFLIGASTVRQFTVNPADQVVSHALDPLDDPVEFARAHWQGAGLGVPEMANVQRWEVHGCV